MTLALTCHRFQPCIKEKGLLVKQLFPHFPSPSKKSRLEMISAKDS